MLSRLSAHTRTTLIKQSLFFFGSGVGVLLVFGLVVLPIFSRMIAAANKQSLLPVNTPAPLVFAPTLDQPYTATNTAQISLKGKGTPNTTVLLSVNGTIGPSADATNSGDFVFNTVNLQKGDNSFVAYTQDAQNNKSEGSPAFTITYATDAPTLDVSEPSDNSTITQRKQQVVAVKGKTDAANKVYINDQFVFVATDGTFEGQFQLQNGSNTIRVRAVNTASNETVKEIHVTYSP